MKNSKRLPLYDIHAAAFLEFKKIPLTLVKQAGRVVFEAPATDETYKSLQEYQQNPCYPLLDFISTLRRLRARMLELRDGGRNG